MNRWFGLALVQRADAKAEQQKKVKWIREYISISIDGSDSYMSGTTCRLLCYQNLSKIAVESYTQHRPCQLVLSAWVLQ